MSVSSRAVVLLGLALGLVAPAHAADVSAEYARQVDTAQMRVAQVEATLVEMESSLRRMEQLQQSMASQPSAADGAASSDAVRALRGDIEVLQFELRTLKESVEALALDTDTRLLWRFTPRRLAIEPWRDAMLQVTGSLDQRIGGAAGNLGDDNYSRRTLYGKIDRKTLSVILKMHDFPDPGAHSARRKPTTTPVQQLFAMNSPFLFKQADRLATVIGIGNGKPLPSHIHDAYRILFQRQPTDDELALGERFLSGTPAADKTQRAARWSQYLHALLASNEFLFVD